MIGYSTDTPQTLVESRGKTQLRYNVQDYERKDEDEVIIEKRFEYVWIEGEVTRKKMIDSLIRAKYDINDEFATMQLPNTDQEYIDYRNFVAECKAIADKAIESVEVETAPRPTESNLVAEIKEYMDTIGIAYNSSDTKADLLQKIEWWFVDNG